jgi:3-hydroxyisobutyrate dehydrogenase-like beta-hydroxyacid dehydrogenase
MKIALIGYGEVGRILAEDLRHGGHAISAYDLALGVPREAGPPGNAASRAEAAERMRAHAAASGVELASSHGDAARDAPLVISAVTASQTVAAATATATGLLPGAFFLDFNSASPGAKLAAANAVTRAGGHYVEGAVMTAVPPHRLRVPLLLGGPHAQRLAPVLADLGFRARVANHELGVASATKMCRSIVIKGLEALIVESLTAARHYGVEAAVLASLRETFPGIDWEAQAAYFFQRAIEHGRRRSEEMREVAVTVSEAGLTPWSSSAAAERHAWMGSLADRGVFGQRGAPGFARQPDWRVEADRILTSLATPSATRAEELAP